jgi:hypothetical protein
MSHLKSFDHGPHLLDPSYQNAYSKGMGIVRSLLQTPALLQFPTETHLDRVLYLESDHPAYLALAKLIRGEHVEPHNSRLEGLGGVTTLADLALKDFLVLSDHDALLLGLTAQQLEQVLLNPDRPPKIVGFGWADGNGLRLVEVLSKASRSLLDSSVSDWLVWGAIGILRSCYVNGMDIKYDAYWQFVFDSMAPVVIRRGDGIRMRKTQDILGEHCYRFLIQGIITLIVGYTTICHLYPDLPAEDIIQYCRVLGGGYDNLAGTDGPLRYLTAERFTVTMVEIFGTDWTGRKGFGKGIPLETEPGGVRVGFSARDPSLEESESSGSQSGSSYSLLSGPSYSLPSGPSCSIGS